MKSASKQKADVLRSIYGGMMTTSDVTRELGLGSRVSAKAWLIEHRIPGVLIGKRIKYETDAVAAEIVNGRM